MPHGLRRFHESGESHFITFSCYRRQPNFVSAAVYDLFPLCLEDMRRRFEMRVYGYVVMPEHVHLLLSEPLRLRSGQAPHGTLADAMHYSKLSFAKRLRSRRQASTQVRWNETAGLAEQGKLSARTGWCKGDQPYEKE